MRRIVIMSVAAAAVAALPGAAHAAVSKADQKATRIVVKVTDPKGDVVAKTGTMNDLDLGSVDPEFKSGHGTAVTPSAADDAIDLTKVVYKIVRAGKTPSLTITYTAKGPFTHSDKETDTKTSFEDKSSSDGVETRIGRDVLFITGDDGKGDTGIVGSNGREIKCKGLTSTMAKGAHVATQTVPLSCLATAGAHTGALVSRAVHFASDITMTVTASGDGGDTTTTTTTTTSHVEIGSDTAVKTRVLPLTAIPKK